MTGTQRTAGALVFVAALGGLSLEASAQTPPTGSTQTPPGPLGARQGQRGGVGRAGGPQALAQGGATDAEIQQWLDALVISKAQNALQLSNSQFNVFLPRLIALQNLQKQHRNQRRKLLADIRGLVGVNAPPDVEETAIAAATRALDDLEAKMEQDEQRALVAIDGVLTVRQRAHFRMFQEAMERQKIDLIVQAKGGTPAPPAAPGPAGGRK